MLIEQFNTHYETTRSYQNTFVLRDFSKGTTKYYTNRNVDGIRKITNDRKLNFQLELIK